MGKEVSSSLDVGAVFRKRVHIILIGAIPLVIFFYGIYMLMSADNELSDSSYIYQKELGLIISAIGLILFIVLMVIDAVKTFKKWKIVKKQKNYFKNQEHYRQNRFFFVAVTVIIFLRIFFRGREGVYEIARLFDWVILFWVLWSVYIMIKKPKNHKV